MPALRFEWDDAKEAQNRRKHGVSFHEAMTVFTDERALLIDDLIIQTRRIGSFFWA